MMFVNYLPSWLFLVQFERDYFIMYIVFDRPNNTVPLCYPSTLPRANDDFIIEEKNSASTYAKCVKVLCTGLPQM